MKKGSILPIALMAFALVAFLVLVNFAITTKDNSGTKNANVVTANENQNVNIRVTNENTNVTSNANTSVNTNTTVDATKDWKTYANSRYDYSFRYPEGLIIESDIYATGAEVAEKINAHFPVPSGNTDPEITQPEFGVEVWETTKELQTYAESIRVQNPKAGLLQKTIVGGRTAYLFTTSEGFTGNGESRLLESEFAFYFTTLESEKSALITWHPTNYSDGSVILSTFTFTDPTAGWKTYENDSLGYSVKYPSDWKISTCADVNTVWFGTQGVVCASDAGTLDFSVGVETGNGDFSSNINTERQNMIDPEQKTQMIGGETGTRLRGQTKVDIGPGSNRFVDTVFVHHGNRDYTIRYSADGIIGDELKNNFENFLKSFVFTN